MARDAARRQEEVRPRLERRQAAPPSLGHVRRGSPGTDPADRRDAHPAWAELLGARAGRPDARRPRRARAVPLEHDPELHRHADRADADARGPCLLARAAGRLRDAAARRDVDGSRRRAHRARVPEPGRDRRPPRQDPFRGADRLLQLHLRVPRGAGRDPRRDHGRRARQLPRRADRSDTPLRLRHRARGAHLAGRTAGVRAVDPGADRRGGEPRHPVHPARPPFARPVRPRRPPAADPRDDDLADSRRSRSTSRRTRASRTGCSTRPACRFRRPRSSRTRRRRWPPRAASATRAC